MLRAHIGKALVSLSVVGMAATIFALVEGQWLSVLVVFGATMLAIGMVLRWGMRTQDDYKGSSAQPDKPDFMRNSNDFAWNDDLRRIAAGMMPRAWPRRPQAATRHRVARGGRWYGRAGRTARDQTPSAPEC